MAQAEPAELRTTHRRLAGALADEPDRRAWHLADAADGPDAHAAEQLELTARRSLTRGDAVGAVAALRRSAELSPDGVGRAGRLSEAAYLTAGITGDLPRVSQLLIDARRADPDLPRSLQAAVAAAILIFHSESDIGAAAELLLDTLDHTGGGAGDVVAEALHVLTMVCHTAGQAELWDALLKRIERIDGLPGDVGLCAQVVARPARLCAGDRERLDALLARVAQEHNPGHVVRHARAALYADRFQMCRSACHNVVADCREGGAVASGIQALTLLTYDAIATGDWAAALCHAEEATLLCDAHGYRQAGQWLEAARALLAALRGDAEATDDHARRLEAWAERHAAHTLRMHALHARVVCAGGAGDFEAAFRHAAAISPPGRLVPEGPCAQWTMLDLVDAAVRTGRSGHARAHAVAIETVGVADLSPRTALLAGAAVATAADDETSRARYEAALAVRGVERWSFDVAHVHLVFGEYLRRRRDPAAARLHLARARLTFEQLGAAAWATRAGAELRASGQTTEASGEPLTEQELEIAALAARGMTNKEIGAQLYLSHRTVAAHLYRVFPKVGITSRAALRDALEKRHLTEDRTPEGQP